MKGSSGDACKRAQKPISVESAGSMHHEEEKTRVKTTIKEALKSMVQELEKDAMEAKMEVERPEAGAAPKLEPQHLMGTHDAVRQEK
jgi:ribosomal protein S20